MQPAINNLEAQKPEISAKYEQARTQLQASEQPLKDRYQSLLDSINTQKTGDVNQQTQITNSELAKRGITGSSTMAQQELQNTTQPINERYTNLSTQTGVEREGAIRSLQDEIANLTPQETSDLRAISSLVANMQSGAATSGLSTGLNLYSTNLQNDIQQQGLAQQASQNNIANALAQSQFDFQKTQASNAQNNQNRYIQIGSGGVYDTKTGQVIQGINAVKAAAGGVNYGGF